MNLDPSKFELWYCIQNIEVSQITKTPFIFSYLFSHAGKILDLRQTVNLSGLSNNSTLTVRPITQKREQSAITVCIQFNGEKQIGEFTSDQSLWEIIGIHILRIILLKLMN